MGNNVNIREVKEIDKDNSLFGMYIDMGGQEIKNMEIEYARVK